MLLILLIVWLVFMLLLPYYVERPVKRVPICTYSLMAINVTIFLCMTVHANVILSGQKASYTDGKDSTERAIINDVRSALPDQFSKSSAENTSNTISDGSASPGTEPNSVSDYNSNLESNMDGGSQSGAESSSDPNANLNPNATATPAPNPYGDPSALPGGLLNQEEQNAIRELQRTMTEEETANTILEEIERKRKAGKISQDEMLLLQSVVWRAEHAEHVFTFDPHPTAYKWLAYWVGAPSVFGFFFSMFVHGGLAHIVGNMLFLWLFGRALEDALGPLIYVLAYLVCGIAAVLLYHITTTGLTPHSAMTPFMGASGAIAGLQGLFAPRFYRTPVRVFYTTMGGTVAMLIAGGAIGSVFLRYIGGDGAFIAGLIVIAGIILMGEEYLWKDFRASAAWVIGGFFVWNDLRPVMMEMYVGRNIDGVAHWAHIGGFLCGVAYAFMVGLTGEGKAEFLTNDARESIEKNYGTSALEYAQDLLKHRPGDSNALRLIAEAYDAKGSGIAVDGVPHAERAQDAWEAAIHAFVQKGDRGGAASAYIQATTKHNGFMMPAKIQLELGSHMVSQGDNIAAAQTLVKIPFTYPDAPEGELALLRSAQLYAQHLHDATMANYLLTTLLQRYPNTQWRAQVEAALRSTQQKINEEQTSPAQDASKQVMPVEVPPAQKPFPAAKQAEKSHIK